MITSSCFTINRNKALIKLNRKLRSVCVPYLIDETFIADSYSELLSLYAPSNAYYWLLYARITEAALLCAGNYADNCEYAAAGDLLVNPRRVNVWDGQFARLTRKNRRGSITEQFKPDNVCAEAFRRNFSMNFRLQIAEPALLPEMTDTLARAGVFCESYLVSINVRMKKIADTISFLLAWHIDSKSEMHRRLALETPESEQFILCNLCRFNPDLFDALGAELFCIEHNQLETSAFFQEKCNKKLPCICMQSENAGISPIPADEHSLSDTNDHLPQCCIKKMAKGWQTHMGVKAIPH
jgi:hypothetical protein